MESNGFLAISTSFSICLFYLFQFNLKNTPGFHSLRKIFDCLEKRKIQNGLLLCSISDFTSQVEVRDICPDFRNFRHVQTFATETGHFQIFATKMIRGDFSDRYGDGATHICHFYFQSFATEKISRVFCDQEISAAYFPNQETAQSTRPNSCNSRILRPSLRRCDFRDESRDGATTKKLLSSWEI